jgi:hypothetical protein
LENRPWKTKLLEGILQYGLFIASGVGCVWLLLTWRDVILSIGGSIGLKSGGLWILDACSYIVMIGLLIVAIAAVDNYLLGKFYTLPGETRLQVLVKRGKRVVLNGGMVAVVTFGVGWLVQNFLMRLR